MRLKTQTLSEQLLIISIFIFVIIFISIGIVIPNSLIPTYEKNIYQYLKEPLLIYNGDEVNEINTDIAYLYITSEDKIFYSNNLSEITNLTPVQIYEKLNKSYGKISYQGKTYYYNTTHTKDTTKIALTNDSYIKDMVKDVTYSIFPILLITFILVLTILLLWSRRLVVKIGNLKNKVDNINNDDYIDNYHYTLEDEFKSLSIAIDNMKLYLKTEEEYKSQMYQNISHDFKTPITVIKSYIEAVEDEVETKEQALKIIEKQILKLENKVHSLLYLNKLSYIQENKKISLEETDIKDLLNDSVLKFKLIRPDIKWNLNVDKKTKFKGSLDHWEAIVDNILNNFVRYADTKININLKNNKLIFFNDGPNIDENILDDIFTPYKKGIKGQFGLGLSIVKKTVMLLGYEVTVKNEKKGISFLIK